jgi:hypothetical protein
MALQAGRGEFGAAPRILRDSGTTGRGGQKGRRQKTPKDHWR